MAYLLPIVHESFTDDQNQSLFAVLAAGIAYMSDADANVSP